jgi:Flp pilus assembly pilin Flp
MTAIIKNFAKSESGAVTVDWVVLTAAIVGLGLAVMAVVSSGVENLSGEINTQLQTQNISTTFVTN